MRLAYLQVISKHRNGHFCALSLPIGTKQPRAGKVGFYATILAHTNTVRTIYDAISAGRVGATKTNLAQNTRFEGNGKILTFVSYV